MKRVFNTSSEVIHLFAQRSQSDARCSNVFFESDGTKIYSYGHHYLLGELLDFNTIWINDSGYSVTTSKHIHEISIATRHLRQYFTTLHDIDNVYSSIKGFLKKLAVARKPEMYINDILHYWKCLSEYIQEQKPKYSKEQKSRLRELRRIIKSINSNSKDFKDKLNKSAVSKAKKKASEAKKRLKNDLEKFFNYDINWFNNKEDYLRISKDGKNIETSQQVKISVEEAKILYTLICQGKDIKGYKIGYYAVTSLNGTLNIGCHNINMDNVHEIGKKL